MPLTSDEQKQALQEEADALRRGPPTEQTAARVKEIEHLLGTGPHDEEKAVDHARRKSQVDA